MSCVGFCFVLSTLLFSTLRVSLPCLTPLLRTSSPLTTPCVLPPSLRLVYPFTTGITRRPVHTHTRTHHPPPKSALTWTLTTPILPSFFPACRFFVLSLPLFHYFFSFSFFFFLFSLFFFLFSFFLFSFFFFFFILPPWRGVFFLYTIAGFIICSGSVYISLSWFYTPDDDNNNMNIHPPHGLYHLVAPKA